MQAFCQLVVGAMAKDGLPSRFYDCRTLKSRSPRFSICRARRAAGLSPCHRRIRRLVLFRAPAVLQQDGCRPLSDAPGFAQRPIKRAPGRRDLGLLELQGLSKAQCRPTGWNCWSPAPFRGWGRCCWSHQNEAPRRLRKHNVLCFN